MHLDDNGDHMSAHHSAGSNVTTPDSGTSLSSTVAPLSPSNTIPYRREFALPPTIPITSRVPANNELQPHKSRPVNLLPRFRYDSDHFHNRYSSRDQLSFQPSIQGHCQPNVYKYEHSTFARPYSLSQGDNLALDTTPSMNTLSQDVQNPLFSSRQMSLPYHTMTSRMGSASQLVSLPYSSLPYRSITTEKAHYQSLSRKDMLEILTYVSFPQCCLKNLE